jgi:RNA polymerase sigma-70 factor (ECF subfamily)
MLRLARAYVRSREEAEEVVQDTWLAVLGGLGRFEGRSTLTTWIFNILVNRARSRAKREARLVPFSAFQRSAGADGAEGPIPAADRLLRLDPGLSSRWHGRGWEPTGPEEGLLAAELHARIDAAISELPPRQQEVITLRDLDGWTSEEVCDALEISEANQRVLLHRARVKVRDALEEYLASPDEEELRPELVLA